MNPEFPRKVESRESLENPFLKITLMRHEEPYYKDIGHDLTPAGVEGARETGRKLREAGMLDEKGLILFHSPAPRAEGTLKFVMEGAGIPPETARPSGQIRKTDFHDRTALVERFKELGLDQERIAKDHFTNDDLYEKSPHLIEPVSHKRERLHRSLEYVLRYFDKARPGEDTPHIFAVSHFEILSPFIDEVFGIETFEKYDTPSFGQYIHVEARKTSKTDQIELTVTFNDRTKKVFFDRAMRTIQAM